MSVQPRYHQSTTDRDARELLQTLIETPLAHSGASFQPVALRSTIEQRRYALRGYLLRTWLDVVLHRAEWLLMLAVLAIFGLWFADGPVRDWLYYQQQADTAAGNPLLAEGAAQAAQADAARVPLPFTTSDMERPLPESEFMAPRQGLSRAPVAVAPQPNRLVIPSISLDTTVKEVFIVNGAWEVADYAVGYLHGTALPGEKGNSVLAGHAGLRGAVFRDLGALSVGADMYVDAAGWRYHYRMRESKSVGPAQVEVLAATDTPVLTLMTCTNWDTQRLVIVADLVGSKPVAGQK